MARAKYQVLVIPYHIAEGTPQYCILRRRDTDVWQFVASGGEDEDASILDAARREAWEEAGIPTDAPYLQLETQCSISTEHFPRARQLWGEDCLVIPEYAFAVEVSGAALTLSHEHTQYQWVDYDTAKGLLRYDSNVTALWELDNRLRLGLV